MTMRVLFVSHAPRLEGAERSMLQVIVRLRDLGHIQPLVVVPRTGRLSEALDASGIEYLVPLRYPWWVDAPRWRNRILGPAKLLWNLFAWLQIRSSVRKFAPQVVYINTLVAPFGWLVANRLKVPFIWHAREFVPEWLERDFDFGRNWSLSRVAQSAAILANSKAVLRAIADHMPAHRCRVVYNGIDVPPLDRTLLERKLAQIGNIQQQTLKLLIVGSVNANKDPSTAVRALKRLRDAGLAAQLTIVGEAKNAHGAQLAALIEQLQLQDVVRIAGWQSDTGAFFREAHITLVTANGEPFGRTIIESMATGTPVIATDKGGAPEILRRVDERLLFPVGDHEALAQTIQGLIESPARYASAALRGYDVADSDFNSERYVNDMLDILSSCSRSGSVPSAAMLHAG